MIQWLQRLVEAFDERMEDEDITPEQKNEYILRRKIIQVVNTVCKAARKSGVESEEFLEVAYKQTQFLAMAPCVETNVLPSFVRLSAMKSVVEGAEAGPEWWALLTPAELSFGDNTVSMGQLHIMQSELVANKVVAMQSQSKVQFRDQIAKLFSDMSSIKAAQLSNDTMKQIEALAMVVRAGVGSEALGTVEQFELFDKAISIIKDSNKAIASSLILFPAGRELCAAAEESKVKAKDVIERNKELEASIAQCESFEAFMANAPELEALDIKPVRAAFVALGLSAQKLQAFDMDSPDGVMPRLKAVVERGACASMAVVLFYLIHSLNGTPTDHDTQGNVKKLVLAFLGFAEMRGASECIRSYLPGPRQAIALLDYIPQGLEMVKVPDLSLHDCSILQTRFQSFAMESIWSKCVFDDGERLHRRCCPRPGPRQGE